MKWKWMQQIRKKYHGLLEGSVQELLKAACFWMVTAFLAAVVIGQSAGKPAAWIFQRTEETAASGQKSFAEGRRAALTFDDGPHPVYTRKLLDGLKERGIQATFFVIGENIPGNEDLICRMQEEGHLIGNHTYHHVMLSSLSKEEACREIEETSKLVKAVTGEDTEFVRPPFGAWKKDMECSFPLIPVLWDVDPLDWTTGNTQLVIERVLTQTEDQNIILMHDCYESSVDAALAIADRLSREGYEFVTADRLILD